MIGRFPWDPFPAGSPDPKGPDPLHAALYRAAVQGSDAYRSVRQVLREERGVLRVGNRFVPSGRYREVGFVALGHAAASMALAALDALGDRLTRGFVAGPEAPPAYLPFRSVLVGDGWGPHPAAAEVVDAAREIALGLRENDLFVLLVSPGASRALLLPPPNVGREELARRLQDGHRDGASASDVGTAARLVGAGGVGGRLLPVGVRCDVQTLLVDRGNGPALTGGGPTVPPTDAELAAGPRLLDRFGLADVAEALPEDAGAPLASGTPRPRPVVVAGPSDALRAATDLAFDKGWTSRVGDLQLVDRPSATVARVLGRADELLPDARPSGPGRSKGLVAISMATLDVPDGVAEGPACQEFLDRALAELRRREWSVGVYRTAGPIPSGDGEPASGGFAGAVVGAATDPAAKPLPSGARALRMRSGITDAGLVVVVVGATSPAPGPNGPA